ncbi:hypothetical protein L2E82_38968 [Cichorium intybus]|uniref:Uncharacterized protein n=1 Tax=Cichorium intybus TaxID=13427 RepID=A0ACB9AHW9_CICIN|nr:hypothetical protein L2E82_38968 [Cichorium intybus]
MSQTIFRPGFSLTFRLASKLLSVSGAIDETSFKVEGQSLDPNNHDGAIMKVKNALQVEYKVAASEIVASAIVKSEE